MVLGELRKVAGGWRWGRPGPRPPHDPGAPVRTEAAYETDWAREPWARAVRGLAQETLLLPGVRAMASPRVVGRERLRTVRPPVVIAANHTSHLDTSIVIEAMPPSWRDRLIVGAAADYFFTGPVKGTLAALLMGAFPVDRKRASATSARTAVRLIQEGFSLVLFPEGGRSETGWLTDVQPGAAFAATKTGRPVVPVWIGGTDHLWPKGGKPKRGVVDVTIGDPLWPRSDEKPRELNARLTETLRRMGREAGSDWWTALRGGGPDPAGPDAARWRRVWARGEGPERPTSSWR